MQQYCTPQEYVCSDEPMLLHKKIHASMAGILGNDRGGVTLGKPLPVSMDPADNFVGDL